MREFMTRRGIFFPNEITLESLTEFRATWNVLYPSSVTRQKVQERLRAFLRYATTHGMIDRVPKLSTDQSGRPAHYAPDG
jgi:integrase/recombinase XerD